MNSRHSPNPPSAREQLSRDIKAEALRLGFFACGIAHAEPVNAEVAANVRQWVDSGKYAQMNYMARHTDMRLNPQLLMPGLESIVSVALNYAPAATPPNGEYQLAAYALGQDYHDIVKAKLHQLAQFIAQAASGSNFAYRAFCDSAPVLERYWAVRAGLGWTGRNHQLIIPHAGSMFFLGELFLNIPLHYDEPMPAHCGTCHACIDACPTGALDGQQFDADRCLSYQTIENRDALSPLARQHIGQSIYGCDRCQQACPWNRFATPNHTPELQPSPELLSMTREQWHALSEDRYRQLFKGSAVKRAKYSGLCRNIMAAKQASEDIQKQETPQ